MIIVNDTAVRADRNVDAGLLEILVTSGCNLDQSGSLTAADALLLTGDADGAAADADLDEVRAGLSEETEALTVNNVARADLNGVAYTSRVPTSRVRLCHSEKPSEESMQRTSAPASTSAGTRSA